MIPRQDENKIRMAAVSNNVCIMTTITGAYAALRGIKAMKQKRVGVRSLQSFVSSVR
jgi:carbamoyl-phosphate synthase large subunit